MPDHAPLSPSGSRVLRKPVSAQGHARSVSAQYYRPHDEPSLPSLQELKQICADTEIPSPLMPPPIFTDFTKHRSSSGEGSSRPSTPGSGYNSRPGTPSLQVPSATSSPSARGDRKDYRKSWFGSGTGKLTKKDKHDELKPAAWIAGHPDRLVYDADGLLNGARMDDIWDDLEGNCLVYLFPRTSGLGPSFKVNSAIFAASSELTRLARPDPTTHFPESNHHAQRPNTSQNHLRTTSLGHFYTPPATPDHWLGSGDAPSPAFPDDNFTAPSTELHLFLPIKLHSDSSITEHTPVSTPKGKKNEDDLKLEDLQTLIDVRNFFAFLYGQSLVATRGRSDFFHIFMSISSLLNKYAFSNQDGSTYGEIARASFNTYVEELGLADVRSSREKTIEGVVLGERMKSVLLYNEAFTHAVGKHEEILATKNPKLKLISSLTENRLQRAAYDLEKRIASIGLILDSFEFPALFTGIMASKTSAERKDGVRFEAWKDAFFGMRKSVLSMLKQKYGDWPPKANAKKNDLETSGLNRLVLKELYRDMCSVYDLLVDRTNLTTRTVDGVDPVGDREEANFRALRLVLSEYDRSSPPVKPPVPFDLPRIPSFQVSRSVFGAANNKSEAKANKKKLKDDEIAQLLRDSYNNDVPISPFLSVFRDMAKRAAHGCNLNELIDQRIGQWIFVYVVLQALPMVACDAPGLKHSHGVEYFLCEPPYGGIPWARSQDAAQRSAWLSAENSGSLIGLPPGVSLHSVDGIYRRSHCWIMAEHWTVANPRLNLALREHEAISSRGIRAHDRLSNESETATKYDTPPSMAALMPPSSRSSSPRGRDGVRPSSLIKGLETLSLPLDVSPGASRASSPGGFDHRPRSAHQVDKEKTFDAILAGVTAADRTKRGKKK